MKDRLYQTRVESLVEVIINTAIGFMLTFLLWPTAAWLFDIPISTGKQFGVASFFTLASVLRGYAIRRWANLYVREFCHAVTLRVLQAYEHYVKLRKKMGGSPLPSND